MPDAKRWHESRQTPSRGCGQRSITADELVDGAPDRASRSGRVLEQQPEVVGQVCEHRSERRLDAREAGLETVAEVRSDVHDHGLGVELRCDLAAGRERHARALDDQLVGAREVDQVRGVADDGQVGLGPARAELLEVLGRVRLCASRPAGWS